jgi:uncharacterized membrane protein YcaP (DUF421 family)
MRAGSRAAPTAGLTGTLGTAVILPSVPVVELVVRTILVYGLFVFLLRVSGKRQLGQFTVFDLTLLLLAANALQPAITGPDNSVGGAVVILATIFGINRLVATFRQSALGQRLLDHDPAELARDGAWDADAVRREGLDDDDLGAALRQHGVQRVEQTALVMLEEDGSISVVPCDQDDAEGTMPPARRRRHRRPRRDTSL